MQHLLRRAGAECHTRHGSTTQFSAVTTSWWLTETRGQLKKATDRLVTGDILIRSNRRGRVMQTRSKTRGRSLNTRTRVRLGGSGGKTKRRRRVYPKTEAAYWRQQHSKQPYAKKYSYAQFEHAYRTGYDSFLKNPDRKFGEVEDSVAVEYEQGKPDAALPWDTVRPAVSSVWERMSGVIGPRDPDRGIRGSI